MPERVRPVDVGTTWDPNSPDAVLVRTDLGAAALALAPFDDDERCVVLRWSRARSSQMSPPNDEAIVGHRLYGAGLRDVLWVGLVDESSLIVELERQNRVHPRHDPSSYQHLQHWIVLLKECVVEVVAAELTVERRHGSTIDAAAAACRGA